MDETNDRAEKGRPLWQVVLPLLIVGVAVRRLAVAYVLSPAEALAPALAVTSALQGLAALATAAGIFWGRSWAVAATLVLGASVAATALIEAFALGALSPFAAISQVLVAGVLTGGLALLLRHEFGPSGTARRSGP